ncbi:uncharacterized protein LOC115092318 isoform X2 [Rhinatrema bivittatum]|uniref:uncharacterized protein LOC115092318 isoform X2 n=1 Tax=Rhinatrema bivittatum TaxID=194408 RepID=UPI00112AFEF6|nr:uncharacterized protein LOC115092318 isoform X2 [Rhinatrema bivittatum]
MESQPIPELDRKMDVAASSVTSENTDILMEEAQLQSNALPASLNKWSQIAEENISLGPKGHADIYVGVRDLETLRDPLGKASSWGEQSSSCRLGEEEESLKYVRSRIGGSVESIFSLASSRSLQTPEWKMLRVSKSQSALSGISSVDWEHTWRREKSIQGTIQDIIEDVVGDEINFRLPAHQGYHKRIDATIYHEIQPRTTAHAEEPNSSSPKCVPLMTPFCCLSESPALDHLQDATILHSVSHQYQPLSCKPSQMQIAQAKSTTHLISSDPAALILDHCSEKMGTQFRTLDNNSTAGSKCNISTNSQMVEAVESQDISLPLLKAILMEREEKINQLSKDLWKMQTENHRLMEEKHFLLSESKNFTREEKTFEEELKSSNHFTFDSSSPIVLQRQIANLKSQINDLQEANESAVLELAKADEDISQQNNEIAKLKAEYFQKIEDSKDEVNCLQEKINRMETCEPGLCEEIRQLRSQSKQLREVNHLLNEENHRLKEEMWDMKRQCQQLVKMLRERKNGDSGAELHWIDLGKKGFSYGDQHRQKGLETDARNGFSEEDWRRSWDGRPGELLKGNGSPVLSSSAGTDFLIADYQENITTRSKDHFKGGDSDEVQELSDNDLSSASHGPSDAHEDLTCHSVVEILSGSTLPRRPFAPRSVADLKIGNLVKFSRPAGKISKGLIKYLGHLFGREDVYVGIELEGSEMGKHDGTFEGRRHFVCKANKGVFVNFNKVIMAWE